MALVDTVLALSKNAQASKPPAQWWWAAILAVASLVAGYLISREMDQAANAAADLELEKAHVRELEVRTAAATDVGEAEKLRLEARALTRDVAIRETELAAKRAALELQRVAILKARTWKELEDA